LSKQYFKNYEKCIEYLFGLERGGIKYNLNNIRKLSRLSSNPEKYFKSIHVAGTNGKGSVASVINSLLTEKGFVTGLYSSPHINDFRERIIVNRKFIEKNFILDYVNRFRIDIEKIKPSFFEVTTAIAFSYFYFKKVDYAVIETGLGGRLDATNIIKPLVSVITSIGIDHVEFLGSKIEHIAKEKAGIIKSKVPVVAGNVPENCGKIISAVSRKNKSELIFSSRKYKIRIIKKSESGFKFLLSGRRNGKFFFPLIGDYQKHNLKTALTALDVLCDKENLEFSNAEIDLALKNIKKNSNLIGRFEIISRRPYIITDVSHNAQAVRNFRGNLKYFKYSKLYVIFAMMSDKQYAESIKLLSHLNADKIILTKPDYKRAAMPDELYRSVFRKKSRFEIKKNVKESYKTLKILAGKKDLILVTGSFFLVSDFLKIFRKR